MRPLGRAIASLILFIGSLGVSLRGMAEEPDPERMAREGKVFVEPTFVSTVATEGEYRLIPYGERRGRLGGTVGLSYQSYEPNDYEANFANQPYGGLYESPTLPMLELHTAFKRNFSTGSLGVELAVGRFQSETPEPEGEAEQAVAVQSTLTLTAVRLGAIYALDNMTTDPKWSPYVSAGAYVIFFNEELDSNSFSGNTLLAPYVSGGVDFPLDWLDRNAARVAYEDSGIERSSLFVEGRMLVPSSEEKDPDFGSSFSWGAGLRIEL